MTFSVWMAVPDTGGTFHLHSAISVCIFQVGVRMIWQKDDASMSACLPEEAVVLIASCRSWFDAPGDYMPKTSSPLLRRLRRIGRGVILALSPSR